jgi:hypothetical protein
MADPIANNETRGALDVLAAEALTSKTGTTARPVISNKDVLEDMQKLYDQKLAEKNYFMQDMADAQAWWSGGAAGPSVGLALRAQTRAQQAKQLEDLQASIMQGKVNIAQLGEASGAMGEPTANVAGLTAGAPASAQANAQATSPAVPGGGYTIRGVPVPEVVYKAYQAYLKQGNLAKATEVFDTYNKEATKGEIGFATNPSAYKQDDYYNEKTGEITGKNPLQIRGGMTAPAPAGAPANAPSAPVLGANTQAAKEAGVPVISGYRGEDKQAQLYNASQQPGYQGNPVAKPGQSLHQTDEAIDVADFKKLKPEQLKWLRENGYQQTMPDTDPNHFAKVPGTAKVSAPTTAPTTTGSVPSYVEAKSRQAGQKSYEEKSQLKAGEAAGGRQGAFESAAVDASKDLQNANVMLNIMDKHPEAVGFSYKNRALGTTIEGVKLLTGKDIEPVARRAALSPEAIEAGNKFDSLAETNNLKFRQAVYKGTGQVSDFETKLSERASGLARDNSLEANRFFATVAAENYRTLDKLGKDWQAYQKSHPGSVFAQFEQSQTWKNAQAERENRLKTYFPEIERGDLGFGSRSPSKGAGDDEMMNWRKRYGTQKGNQ